MNHATVAAAEATHASSLDERLGLLLLGSFLVTFLVTRLWVRMQRSGPDWWPSSLTSGDTHVHHLVPGIFLVLITGFLGIVGHWVSPWADLIAIAFGAGAALTLDEYALWLHLEDVYWAEEGRRSVDVIVFALVFGLFVVVGSAPFGTGQTGSSLFVVSAIVIDVVGVTLSALKGKHYMAGIGIFAPGVAMFGGLRAARPGSWWARRFYSKHPGRLEKGRRRADRWSARRTRWWDLIGGKHGEPPSDG